MYDVIYNAIVDAHVAHMRESSMFMDRSRNIVDKDSKCGEAIDIEITHPNYILFGNKTRCNDSQKKDGHEAGTKYIVGLGQVQRTSYVTANHQFTLLPIMLARGLPIMCVVIFQGGLSQVPTAWASGIDIQLQTVRDSDGIIVIDESYFGKDKYFLDGPTWCTFQGIDILCATYITEGGRINGNILVDVL
jgi:hypothetical protein